MAPVTIIVPNNIAGIVARRHLARGLAEGSNGVAAIYVTTLPRLAEQLAAPSLTSQGRRPATRPITAAAIRARLDAEPGAFEPVAAHPSTARALALASRELRDVDEAVLDQIGEASTLASHVVRLHRKVSDALSRRWYDTTDLLTTATALVRDGTVPTARLGTLLVYLPQDLTRAETAFARVLGERAPVHVIAGLTGTARADQGPLAALSTLTGGTRFRRFRGCPIRGRG